MITFQCDCGKKLQVKDEYAGKAGRCPACNSTFHIPDQETAARREAAARHAASTSADDFEAEFSEHSQLDPEERQRYQERSQNQEGEVLTHKGKEIPGGMDFFIEPPEEIGRIFTAYSTMKKKDEPMSPNGRIGLIAGVGGGTFLAGLIIGLAAKSAALAVILSLVLGGIAVAIAVYYSGFKHTCTYVGQNGIAKITCTGSRDNCTEDVFIFEDATELRTEQTRHYLNGAYQNTQYSYTWNDISGRKVHAIIGSYRSEEGDPPQKDLFNYALSAEKAWTFHLLEQIQAQLQTQGTIFFGLKGKNWVRLGEGTIIIRWKGEESELYADEIEEVRISDGMFEIRRTDAKEGWFSSRGIYRFPYGELGNAQLFLIILQEVVGISFN